MNGPQSSMKSVLLYKWKQLTAISLVSLFHISSCFRIKSISLLIISRTGQQVAV